MVTIFMITWWSKHWQTAWIWCGVTCPSHVGHYGCWSHFYISWIKGKSRSSDKASLVRNEGYIRACQVWNPCQSELECYLSPLTAPPTWPPWIIEIILHQFIILFPREYQKKRFNDKFQLKLKNYFMQLVH